MKLKRESKAVSLTKNPRFKAEPDLKALLRPFREVIVRLKKDLKAGGNNLKRSITDR